jgi:hypothetical protein
MGLDGKCSRVAHNMRAAHRRHDDSHYGATMDAAVPRVARRWSGEYSLTRVAAFGMAAPSPTPVTKRSTASSARLVENDDHTQATPNSMTEAVGTTLY